MSEVPRDVEATDLMTVSHPGAPSRRRMSGDKRVRRPAEHTYVHRDCTLHNLAAFCNCHLHYARHYARLAFRKLLIRPTLKESTQWIPY